MDGGVLPFSQHGLPEKCSSSRSRRLSRAPMAGAAVSCRGSPAGPALCPPCVSRRFRESILVAVSQGYFCSSVGGCSADRGVSLPRYLTRGVLQMKADFSYMEADVPAVPENSPVLPALPPGPLVLSGELPRSCALTRRGIVQQRLPKYPRRSRVSGPGESGHSRRGGQRIAHGEEETMDGPLGTSTGTLDARNGVPHTLYTDGRAVSAPTPSLVVCGLSLTAAVATLRKRQHKSRDAKTPASHLLQRVFLSLLPIPTITPYTRPDAGVTGRGSGACSPKGSLARETEM